MQAMQEPNQTETGPKLTPLPRHEDGSYQREFMANGKKYIIRQRSEGIGIHRYSEYLKMGLVAGYGVSVEDYMANINKAKDLVNDFGKGKGDFLGLSLHLQAMQDSVFSFQRSRYDMMFVFCTMFIVWENEDMTKWVLDEQLTKIDDWNIAGYNENDFLALGLANINGYLPTLKKSAQQGNENQNQAQL